MNNDPDTKQIEELLHLQNRISTTEKAMIKKNSIWQNKEKEKERKIPNKSAAITALVGVGNSILIAHSN